jgi:hypothetical protein
LTERISSSQNAIAAKVRRRNGNVRFVPDAYFYPPCWVQAVAEQKLRRTIPFRVSADETLDIGEDTGTPVCEDYHVPFKFTGKLNRVVVRLAEAALTPEEQKQLDEQEGANELID